MTKRRRILHADKIIQNAIQIFCLLMFLQLKGYYSVTNNPILLYSTSTDIKVANISRPNKLNTIIKGLEQGSAVDFLHRKKLFCWSDQSAELIQCTDYNDTHTGEKVRIVSDGLMLPTGIAIDWYTEKLYWTDGETNRIEVISIEHRHRKVLFWSDVDLARAIAVVPSKGLMFWTDWGEIPKIEKAGMDGDPATRKVIVKNDISWPNGITIDYDNDNIYWVDTKLHFVDVVDFNGENRRRVIKSGLHYPYALAFFNDKLYWTDWHTWAIYSWDIKTNGPTKDLIKSHPVPVDIKVYEESRQIMPEGDYPCKVNNGGCSHLCLLSSNNSTGYICACPTGVKLKEGSNTTCYSGPRSILLVAQKSIISKISLDSPDYTPQTLPLKDLKRALTVDFDPKTEYMYWADTGTKAISRARLDGSEQSVVIHSGGMPDSIAIDPLARNIYWTDAMLDTISVARLDGSSKKVLVHDELYEPRAIALHLTAGWMFWSDWNEKRPKIERSNLDGTERVLLVSENLTWPNGIALDTVNNKMYWGDAKTHTIEMANMDGTMRRVIHSSDISHIFGLSLLGDHLYWTDMQKRTLDRINKYTGADRQCVVEQLANMMGMKAFTLGAALGWNACADSNGGCSHLCFYSRRGHACSCPLGLELSNDLKTCVEPEAFLVYSRKNVIGRVSVESARGAAVLPVPDLREVSALAVDVSGSKIYWADSKTKTINRCSVNGSNMEKILEGIVLVEGLAIDGSAQNIYWTDMSTQRIEVARLDGSSRRTLIWQGLKKPKSIVLDPRKGYMYWSELGSKSIKRAAMDGSSPTVIHEQVGRVQSLSIDYTNRALYWAALDPPAVERALLNATTRQTICHDVPMPYAVTQYKDNVFWGDWNTGLIEMAKKSDGSGRKVIHSNLDYISDLKVYHRGNSGNNQCGVDNGGCSHLCLPLPVEYRCACPTHYKLNADNLTCSEPEEFVLYALKNSLGRIMVVNGESVDATIPLSGLKNVKAIDYDPVNKHLYWMDDDSQSIRRVPISYSPTTVTSDASPVVTNLARPFHLALDVLGRALYWTCADSDSINATTIDNLDNITSGVILRGDGMMPRHLAFHQTKRYLIWNDIGLGAIMMSEADGSRRTELSRAHNASALTVDVTGTVYWAQLRQILAVDLDGTNKRTVWQGSAVALAALGPALLLSAGGGVWRLPARRRDAPAQPLLHLPAPPALRPVPRVAREHACFGGRRCGGAPGACGRDGACGCGVPCAAPACPRGRVPCAPGACVPAAWRCDGQRDCASGADEEGCADAACAGGVRCADGACAPALALCDAGVECARPVQDAFRCDDRLCLAARLLCDGRAHCADGSDESACQYGLQTAAPASDPSTPARQSNAPVICGVVGALCALAGAGAALRRCRRPARPPPRPLPLKPVPPPPASTQSSGSSGRYPGPTANPPPSPATLSLSPPRRRAPRPRPPPPTPASTDVENDESPRPPPPSPLHHPLLHRAG